MDRWNGRRLEKGGGAVLEKEKGLRKRGKQEQNEAAESVARSCLTRSGGEECCVWEGDGKKKKETRRGWSERVSQREKRERENRCEGKEGEKVEGKSVMEEVEGR